MQPPKAASKVPLKVFNVDESNKGSEIYQRRLAKAPNVVDIVVKHVELVSIFSGQLSVPRLVGISYVENSEIKVRLVHLSPVDFLPSNVEVEFVEKSLLENGFIEDGSEVILGHGPDDAEFEQKTENLFNALPMILSILKEIHETVGLTLVLSFCDLKSRDFLFGMFTNPSLSMHRSVLFDVVEEIEFGNESELMTEELLEKMTLELQKRGDRVDPDLKVCLIYLDGNFATFQSTKKKSITRFTELAAFCERDQKEAALSTTIPIRLNDNLPTSDSSDWLTRSLAYDTKAYVYKEGLDEKNALVGLCKMFERCCACGKEPAENCDLALVTFSLEHFFPILLSKIEEYDLVEQFYKHLVSNTDVIRLARYVNWKPRRDIFEVFEAATKNSLKFSNIACIDACLMMHLSFNTNLNLLTKLLRPNNKLKICPNEKLETTTFEAFFDGHSSDDDAIVVCKLKKGHSLEFSKEDNLKFSFKANEMGTENQSCSETTSKGTDIETSIINPSPVNDCLSEVPSAFDDGVSGDPTTVKEVEDTDPVAMTITGEDTVLQHKIEIHNELQLEILDAGTKAKDETENDKVFEINHAETAEERILNPINPTIAQSEGDLTPASAALQDDADIEL